MMHWLVGWLDAIAKLVGGPGRLRFVLQPLVALVLGVRDGRNDARAHVTPFLWRLIFVRSERRTSWRSAAAALAIPFVIATVLDAVLQYVTLRTIRPGYAVLTGCLLVGLPYAIVRAVTNRVVSAAVARHHQPA